MKPYNPLEKENLGKSVADSLVSQTPVPLGKIERFHGAGVYAIYYTGDFEAYANLGKWNRRDDVPLVPIYVGKAIPTGGRKGNVDPQDSPKGTALFKRLVEHRKSIEQTPNLDVADFSCRFLVVDDIWIPLGESLLIQKHRPIWNSVVDGFGNYTPGKGRFDGARPSWDTLHPGRPWADKCAPSNLSEAQIREQIGRFWASYEGFSEEG